MNETCLKWFKGYECVRCGWDLNYANINWWIDVLNCLWNLIESMIMELEKICIVLRHEAWTYKCWTWNEVRFTTTGNGNFKGTSPRRYDCKLSLPRGKPHIGKLAWACIWLFLWVWCFYTMSSFARRISMHKSLNRKELMYISIEWLHDLNAIVF
jgi:hypothetical protein